MAQPHQTSTNPSSSPPPPPPPSKPPQQTIPKDRDFLIHLETYLAKRDGVDKLLKISRYASKLLLSSTLLPSSLPLTHRLKSFESNVGISRKAFRLGKFIQDINALRSTTSSTSSLTRRTVLLSILAYGGEGIYYFIEQIVWLSKSGLIDSRHARELSKLSAWAELVGYVGSVLLKIDDLKELSEKSACLAASVEVAGVRGESCEEEKARLRAVERKMLMKRMSIVQDLADGLMAVADVRNGEGKLLSSPLLLSSAGLLSALISTHKNWVSC